MYRSKLFFLSDVSAGGGLVFGLTLTQWYTILGIILTVLSIVVLIINFILRMYDRLKDGKFTNEEKAETAKEILELKETIDELQKELDKHDRD